MTRYYCSGFDINDAFGYGLGDMFLNELKDTKSIVYIPGGTEKVEKGTRGRRRGRGRTSDKRS